MKSRLKFFLLFFLSTFLFFFSTSAYAQAKMKSAIEKEVTVKGDKQSEQVKSEQHYDINGNVTEEWEYDDEGKLKSHFVNEYNSKNEKVKETELSDDGKIITDTVYEYDEHGNRISKTVSDRNGNVMQKKVFVYEYYY